MKPHKIAIVGSGMGGLSAGMLLARLGHAVTLFERFDEPKSVGAGILIQPSGLVALERLGLRAEVEAKGSRIDAFFGATLSGRRVMGRALRRRLGGRLRAGHTPGESVSGALRRRAGGRDCRMAGGKAGQHD